MSKYVLLILLSSIILEIQGQTPSPEANFTTILEAILQGYDRRLSPDIFSGQPTVMDIGVYIIEMHSVSDDDLQFSTSIFLRRTWRDPRLEFSSMGSYTFVVRDEYLERFWTPDIFFPNERDAHFHEYTKLNEAMWLDPDGTVFLTTRYSLVLSCPMNLQDYPLDTQQCNLEIETYSYETNQLRLRWRSELPLVVPDRLFLQTFSLEGYELVNCASLYTTGGFSCLRVTFTLQRNLGYHMITTFIPSAFVVTVSWVGFWIPPEAVPARASLGVTAVLSIITQLFIGGLNQPQVPYIKAIDVWMAMIISMVFASIIEFAIVNVVLRLELKARLRQQAKLTLQNSDDPSDTRGQLLYQIAAYMAEMNPGDKLSVAELIDWISRALFPLFFVIFTISYSVYYEQQDIDVPERT